MRKIFKFNIGMRFHFYQSSNSYVNDRRKQMTRVYLVFTIMIFVSVVIYWSAPN